MPHLPWLYAAVLYAIGVAVLRRVTRDLPWRIAFLFFALVLIFLWRPLTGAGVLGSPDVIRLTPPWSEMRAPNRPPVTKYEVSNLNVHDVGMQLVPWLHQVRTSWRNFDVPLWNDAAGCGYPLLANGQSTPFSPLHLVTLPLSLASAMAVEAALKLLAALVFAFLFCRRRYSTSASAVAAISWGFSTWITTWLQFPIAFAAALLPAVLLVIDLLIERITTPRVIAAASIFAVTVIGGHPETVYHVGLIAAAYGLWVALIESRERKFRGVAGVLLASVLALLIASPAVVPFAEAVLRSQRFAELHTPRSIVPPYSDFTSAILLLQPRFYGELPIERPWGASTMLEAVCGFAGILAIVAAAAVALHVIATRRWRERETLYVLAFIACIGIVLGWPLLTTAFHALAGLAPAMRMRLGICWFGSVLVAAAIDEARRGSRMPLLAGTALVSALIFWLMRTTAFPTPSHRDTALLAFLPSIAVLAALTLPMRRPLIAVLGALIFVELWLANGGWNVVVPARELYPSTPVIRALQDAASTERAPFRVLGTGGELYPNTGAMFGLEDVRVHDPMASSRYVSLLTQLAGWNADDYYAKWNATNASVLDFMNVRYIVADRELRDERYQQIYAGRDGRLYANRGALPRFFAVRNIVSAADLRSHTDWRYTAVVERLPRADRDELSMPWTAQDTSVAIERKGAASYRLHVRAPRKTLIVSSVAYWPGWHLGGGLDPLEVNGAFLGFVVPAGERDVTIVYRPMSFWVPAGVSVLTMCGVIIVLLRRTM